MTTGTSTEKDQKKELVGTRLPANGISRLEAKSFGELTQLANVLATSDIVPKDLRGKPANVLLVLMFGNEIGITPAQALQSVFVVNGRPTLFGDVVMGLCIASPFYEDSSDSFDPTKEGGTATFRAKRKGKEWVTRTFSMADAVKAKLDKKEGPWQEYPKRMLFHRARSWALRDTFPDALKGIRYFEEERDVVNLERSGEKEYAMPTEKPASAPAPIDTTAAPAAASAPAAPSEKKPEGEIFDIQVSGVATTDFDGNPDCFCIRDRSEPKVKFYTDNPAHANLAKGAETSGARLGGVYVEKTIGKTKARWILAIQAKA